MSKLTATAVASTARLLARAGLVEGFGHVSAREGEGFLLTPTRPLGAAGTEDVHALDAEGPPRPAPRTCRSRRPCTPASTRAVPTSARSAARIRPPRSPRRRDTAPPLLHGLGALAGEVRTCSRTDLVADQPAAEEATAALGAADCLVLRANGCLATGTDLAEAAVRAYFLEERCRVALEAGETGREMSGEQLRDRLRWTATEGEWASRWLVVEIRRRREPEPGNRQAQGRGVAI